jgi:hypothetical protein
MARSDSNDPALKAMLVSAGPLDPAPADDKVALADRLSMRTIADVFRRADGRPVRQVTTGNRGWAVGEYVSYKSMLRHPWESKLERCTDWMDEVDRQVFHTLAQPHTLVFHWAGRRYVYTPDREIWSERGHLVREVKTERELADDPNLKRKLEIVGEIYHALGCAFQVLTEPKILVEPRLPNAYQIQQRRRLRVTVDDELRILDLLDQRQHASLSAVAARVRDAISGEDIVMALACRRKLHIDLGRELGPGSVVRVHDPTEPAQPSIAVRRPRPADPAGPRVH